MNPQSSSNSNSTSTDGTGGGKEGEAEAPNPRPYSSSNQASLDGTGGKREKEAKMPNLHTCSSSNRAVITLAVTKQVWMVPKMGGPNPHMRGTRHRMKIPVLSHQKSDATYTCFDFGWRKRNSFLVQSRGRNIFNLCLPCPDWAILNLGDTQGFWREFCSSTLTLTMTISLPKSQSLL